MKYLLSYKIIYILLIIANLVYWLFSGAMDDTARNVVIVSFPYLALNVYSFLQMKNRTVKPWVYLAERIITIGGMVMLGLMAIPAGFFIVQLSPVFISFWGAIFLNLLSLVEYQDKVILFAYHFLIFLAVFSIEFFYFQFLGRYKRAMSNG